MTVGIRGLCEVGSPRNRSIESVCIELYVIVVDCVTRDLRA